MLPNARHERFAQELAAGKTADEAYALAGLERTSAFPASGFYVYALIDPTDGRVFYIGKGTGNRRLRHEKECRSGKITNAAKHDRIDRILDAGMAPAAVCLAGFESERAALACERAFIAAIGFSRLTNILPGTMTEKDKALAECRSLLRRIEPFCVWLRHKPKGCESYWYWKYKNWLEEMIAAFSAG